MKLRNTLEGHEGQVLCARFGPTGRRVATGSRDKTIGIWSLRSGKRERVLEGHTRAVTVLAISPSGELISGDSGGNIKVWSWPRGKLLLELNEHVGAIYTLGCSADGSLIASGAKDQSICVWSRESGELLHRFDVGARGMSFAFSADGEYLVSGRNGDTFSFWSLDSGELAYEQEAGPGTIGALQLDHSREWVVSRGWRGPITIWSANNWGYAAVLPIIEKGLGGATLRPGYEQLVAVYDHGIGLFDSENGALLDSFEIPTKNVYDVDVSPDGSCAIAASADEVARIFEFEELEEEDEDESEDEDSEDDEELEED